MKSVRLYRTVPLSILAEQGGGGEAKPHASGFSHLDSLANCFLHFCWGDSIGLDGVPFKDYYIRRAPECYLRASL